MRGDQVVWTGKVSSMRHFKDEVARVCDLFLYHYVCVIDVILCFLTICHIFTYVNMCLFVDSVQVNKGSECGILLEGCTSVQVGDVIQSVDTQMKKRSLDDRLAITQAEQVEAEDDEELQEA